MTAPPEGPREDVPGRARVLVVEDSFLAAEALASMVRELGYDVVGPVAEVGRALAIAGEERIDAALLDVDLRGQLVTPVADRLAERGVPFVFLTAFASLRELSEAHRDVPRVPKPCTLEMLAERLVEVVGAEPRRRESPFDQSAAGSENV